METFLALTEERQKEILDGAMRIFGKLGYKKASTGDIAKEVGVSKGMIFRYFGSKRGMYLYLVHFAGELAERTMKMGFDPSVGDFFDRVVLLAERKLSLLRCHPALFGFLSSAYFERDGEVAEELKKLFSHGEAFRNQNILNDADMGKFKESVNPRLVLEILVKMAEGYSGAAEKEDLDGLMKEFYDCISMMKEHFYKEEYL